MFKVMDEFLAVKRERSISQINKKASIEEPLVVSNVLYISK